MSNLDSSYAQTIPAMIHGAARQFGDRPLVIASGSMLTYADADRLSQALAMRMLQEGIGKGTRVGVHYAYGEEWVIAWLAATRIGALLMPFSTASTPFELAKLIRIADVDTLLAPAQMLGRDHAEFLDQALPGLAAQHRGARFRLAATPFLRRIWLTGTNRAPWATSISVKAPDAGLPGMEEILAAAESEVKAADLMVSIFTSGTTSDPKGVLHTHGGLLRQAAVLATMLDYKSDDRIFAGMPFFWIGGICYTLMAAMQVGATLVCMDRVEPEGAAALMEQQRVSRIIATPGMMAKLMAVPGFAERDIPALRDPVHSPYVPLVHDCYGMSETCGPCTGAGPEAQSMPIPDGLLNSMGPLLPGMEMRFLDPESRQEAPPSHGGIVQIRGDRMMAGYYKREREDAFTPDGWHETGDRGFIRDGLFFFAGRLNEMIKTSGNNVAPIEVEKALYAVEGVAEAHVVGVPDAQRGQMVVAFVVGKDGANLDAAGLEAQLRKTLSAYKVPRRYFLTTAEEIPKFPSGKPRRQALLELAIAMTR